MSDSKSQKKKKATGRNLDSHPSPDFCVSLLLLAHCLSKKSPPHSYTGILHAWNSVLDQQKFPGYFLIPL